MLKVSCADFFYLIYQHIVLPPESPFAAIRVSIPSLNLLIIVVQTFANYKIYYCDNCPTQGQTLKSQLRPLINNPTLTQVLPLYPNHIVAHTVKQLNNPPPKIHLLNSLIKNHVHKRPNNIPTQSLLLPNLQIDLVLLETSPPHIQLSIHAQIQPNASTTRTTPNKHKIIAILRLHR